MCEPAVGKLSPWHTGVGSARSLTLCPQHPGEHSPHGAWCSGKVNPSPGIENQGYLGKLEQHSQPGGACFAAWSPGQDGVSVVGWWHKDQPRSGVSIHAGTQLKTWVMVWGLGEPLGRRVCVTERGDNLFLCLILL